MTRSFLTAIVLLPTITLTGCFELGGSFPVGDDGYCVGVGIGVDGDKVDWADVSLHQCVPEGYYTCDTIDVGYTGSFGGASCQGAYGFPDAYTISFVTSRDITSATIEWESDMMDAPQSEVLYPVWVGDSNYEWVVHFPNPGYTSDGDRIEFTINTYIGDTLVADPVVTATLDGIPEDVSYSASKREYKSSW